MNEIKLQKASMNKIDTFNQFLTNSSSELSLTTFMIAFSMAILLSFIHTKVYVKFGRSLTNRHEFSKNLMLLSLTTLLIIAIVKSSLALSLGLVGALSIVRFRSAVKEPEELLHLFLAIGIGLGLGANQFKITFSAMILIFIIIAIRELVDKKGPEHNLYLNLSLDNKEVSLSKITEISRKYCEEAVLKRYDENDSSVEALLLIHVDEVSQLELFKEEIFKLSPNAKISFMENKGIL